MMQNLFVILPKNLLHFDTFDVLLPTMGVLLAAP